MNPKLFASYLIIIIFQINSFLCDDILGCGGFVKSSFLINYSRVEIKLYTKQGSLKYQTDCAPNNGYYFTPLYDKGDYILKIEPPLGWSFEPSAVELHVDGTTDSCSLNKDINFFFKGFSLSGQVLSQGESSGPDGIKLVLKTSAGEIQGETRTNKDGHYNFPSLLPGKYVIEASHLTWVFEQATEVIQIAEDNVKAKNSIVVAGYDVKGSVFSEGEPIQGVIFMLFSNKDIRTPRGCIGEPVKSFNQKEEMKYVCHVVSSKDGKFLFPSLSPGDYKLVPFYKGEHIEFDVSPPSVDFTVAHGSLEFPKSFQVQGFSVSGKISTHLNGQNLEGAEIYLDGSKYTTSDSNGMYHLENMRAGTYQIEVKMPDIFFESVAMKVTPNTPRLPNIYASKFSVCGRLVIDEYPIGVSRSAKSLVLKSVKTNKLSNIQVESSGKFCYQASPGKYELEPFVPENEINLGLQFVPRKQIFEVLDKPLSDIVLKQFRTDIQGKINCIETCDALVLDLAPQLRDRAHTTTLSDGDGHFEFKNCLPGNYVLSLMKEDWCFQMKTIKFAIESDKKLTNLEFQQTGFQAVIALTHASSFKVKYPSGESHSIELQKSKNVLCLPEPGIYEFIPVGCHLYHKDAIKFDTNNPLEINLSPTKHLITGSVLTELNVTDMRIMVKRIGGGSDSDISLKEPVDMKDGLFRYTFSVFMPPNSEMEVRAVSRELLFRPAYVTINVINDCIENAVEIKGKQGLFVKGSISPTLEGVKIKVLHKKTNELYKEVMTDKSGSYVVGPLEDVSEYAISAEKMGYVFTALEGVGKFLAYKLAEVVVIVEDEEKNPLSGVLLSLSGGKDYRKNSITQKDGKLAFSELGPGQYFLRPMLKEFRFEPSTKMIDIKEGAQVTIKISGKRVAYSLFGVVNSLTGEAEVGVAVEVVSIPSEACSHYQEDTVSEQGGQFRIRGLQPGCEYKLHLKPGAEVNQHIERATPSELKFKVTNGDITGVRLIAFRYYGQLDISGNVQTKQEYIPTLKVRVYKEDIPDQAVNSVSLGQSSFFYLPSMPIDNKFYTLQVESSLSSNSYHIEQPKVTFCANTSFYHFTFSFEPRVKSVDQEVTQGSLLAFPLVVITLLLAYNYQKLQPLFNQLILFLTSLLNTAQTQSSGESVSSESASIKRKTKPKKIQ